MRHHSARSRFRKYLRPRLEPLEDRRLLATFTVNDTGDEPDSNLDDNICEASAGRCTLRAAIMNAEKDAAPDTIEFLIGGSHIAGVPSIATSGFSILNGPIRILGNSQPGSQRIELAGPGSVGNGIRLAASVVGDSSGSEIRGLVINGFETAIQALTDNTKIAGNWIGTDVTGQNVVGNTWGITANGEGAEIGGVTEADRNVVVGSQRAAIAVGNKAIVQNNRVGTNPEGTLALGNSGDGIIVSGTEILVGGGDLGNLIAASGGNGIVIPGQFSNAQNEIFSNLLGVDINGQATAGFGNAGHGIFVGGADNNFIGGVNQSNTILSSGGSGIFLLQGSSENNITANHIGLSGEHGIHITGNASVDNILRANRIGTDATGEVAMPNEGNGVFLENVPNTLIEGGLDGSNVIASNRGHGIEILDGFAFADRAPVISGALIGVSPTGAALPNLGSGILIQQNQTSRGTNVTVGPGNTISSNGRYGVEITGGTFSHLVLSENRILGSNIGTTPDGGTSRPNAMGGVLIQNVLGNTVGGDSLSDRNIISGNGGPGVEIRGVRSRLNVVQGSWIGPGLPLGAVPLGNVGHGILLTDSATNNTIGSALASARTVVSANAGYGIELQNGANDNTIIGTFIGTDHGGGAVVFDEEHVLGNALDGIFVNNVSGTQIGGTIENTTGLQFNVISGNADSGIRIEGSNARGTVVQGNIIGGTFVGEEPLGNGEDGIRVQNQAGGNLIGGISTSLNQGNSIVHNQASGIAVSVSSNNAILRNRFLANGKLAIDLDDDGVTPNDPSDSDAGSNGLQNFPVITSVEDRVAAGVFAGAPNTLYRLELFTTPEPDSTDHGEGTNYLSCTEVTTDAQGAANFEIAFAGKNSSNLEFCGQNLPLPNKVVDFTATATEINTGNTSEFSPIFSGVDIVLADITASLEDAVRQGNDFFLPVQITARNDSDLNLENVAIDLTVESSTSSTLNFQEAVNLVAKQPQVVEFLVPLTEMLDAGNGVSSLSISGFVDSTLKVPETAETNNRTKTPLELNIDARPVLAEIRSDHQLPAFFLDVFAFVNPLDVFVEDWNGNLPDDLVAPQTQVSATVFRNNELLPELSGVLNPGRNSPNFQLMVDTGKDLKLGVNEFQFSVLLEDQWSSLPRTISLDQVESSIWLSNAFSSIETKGKRYEKVTEFKGGFQFPNIALEGFFDLPVERVSFLEGAFGSNIQFLIRPSFKTDGSSEITGQAELSFEVGDIELTGGNKTKASFGVTGRLQTTPEHKLELESMSVKMNTTLNFHSPKKPVFPVPPIFVSGFWGGGLESSINFEVDDDGELGFENVTLTPQGTLGGSVLVGVPKVAFIEGTVSGTASAQFQLPPDPTLNARFDATGAIQAVVRLLTFEVKSPKFDIQCTIFGNGTCPNSEGESGQSGFSQFQLAERESFLTGEGNGGGDLPQLTYAYAVPSLATHTDGTRTLVYVGDDANKLNGQQLEIYATTFDGTDWSAPVAITDDTMLDDRPSVAYADDGTAVAVWSRVNRTLVDPSNVQPSDFLADFEIFFSTRDPQSGLWSDPAPLTTNSGMDFLPSLERDAQGNIVALWKFDTESTVPVIGDEGTTLESQTLFSTWDGTAWSEPSLAVTTGNADRPEFAPTSDAIFHVWSEDADRDATTLTDRSVQLSAFENGTWSTPQTIATTDGTGRIESPRVVHDGDQTHVVWVVAGAASEAGEATFDQLWIRSYDGSQFAAASQVLASEVINEPELLVDQDGNVIAVWQGQGPNGLDLFYSLRNKDSGNWSAPEAISEDEHADWLFQPFVNEGGSLEVIYVQREIESNQGGGEGEDPPPPPGFGQSNLVSQTVSLGPDLAWEFLQQASSLQLPSNSVGLELSILNQGNLPAPTSVLEIQGTSGQQMLATINIPELAAGEEFQTAIEIAANNLGNDSNIRGILDIDDLVQERVESNNLIELPITLTDSFLVHLGSTGLASVNVGSGQLRTIQDSTNLFARDVDLVAALTIVGTEGSDSIELARLDEQYSGTISIDGGLGHDHVQLVSQGQTLDFRGDLQQAAQRVEVVDIQGTGPNTLFANFAGIMQLAPDQNRLHILHDADDIFSLDSGWEIRPPQEIDGRFAHTLRQEQMELLLSDHLPNHNPAMSNDVNRDQAVTAIDALLVINVLNTAGAGSLPDHPSDLVNHIYLDTSGDQFVSAIDALLVISALNRRNGSTGEGEQTPHADVSAGRRIEAALGVPRLARVAQLAWDPGRQFSLEELLADMGNESYVATSSLRTESEWNPQFESKRSAMPSYEIAEPDHEKSVDEAVLEIFSAEDGLPIGMR
ncbi:MAG: dockerin type I domain-containing protein [Planctomycetota bacterium]